MINMLRHLRITTKKEYAITMHPNIVADITVSHTIGDGEDYYTPYYTIKQGVKRPDTYFTFEKLKSEDDAINYAIGQILDIVDKDSVQTK